MKIFIEESKPSHIYKFDGYVVNKEKDSEEKRIEYTTAVSLTQAFNNFRHRFADEAGVYNHDHIVIYRSSITQLPDKRIPKTTTKSILKKEEPSFIQLKLFPDEKRESVDMKIINELAGLRIEVLDNIEEDVVDLIYEILNEYGMTRKVTVEIYWSYGDPIDAVDTLVVNVKFDPDSKMNDLGFQTEFIDELLDKLSEVDRKYKGCRSVYSYDGTTNTLTINSIYLNPNSLLDENNKYKGVSNIMEVINEKENLTEAMGEHKFKYVGPVHIVSTNEDLPEQTLYTKAKSFKQAYNFLKWRIASDKGLTSPNNHPDVKDILMDFDRMSLADGEETDWDREHAKAEVDANVEAEEATTEALDPLDRAAFQQWVEEDDEDDIEDFDDEDEEDEDWVTYDDYLDWSKPVND